MFIPALIIFSMTSGDSEAGPIVQTIFVLLRGSIIVCCLLFSSVHRITAGWPVDARTSLSPVITIVFSLMDIISL